MKYCFATLIHHVTSHSLNKDRSLSSAYIHAAMPVKIAMFPYAQAKWIV